MESVAWWKPEKKKDEGVFSAEGGAPTKMQSER